MVETTTSAGGYSLTYLRKVEIVPYDPGWPVRAVELGAHVATVLGDVLVRMEHVGSTSVPGLAAKPVIDLMPIVTGVTLVDALRPEFEAAGYSWYGEFGLPGRRYINRDDPDTGMRLCNVHMYAEDDPEVVRHLAFPRYLAIRSDLADEYAAIKRRCAAENPADVHAYNVCKSDWIRRVEAEASEWWISREPARYS
ncbi:MAG: GrpB family protein [Chloroflexota bacterium]|nr:GrpB family protein [Chloroflexota bacterium]